MDEDLRRRYRRDFTAEPVITTPHSKKAPAPTPVDLPKPLVTTPSPASHSPQPKRHRKIKWLIYGLIVVLVAGAAWGGWRFYNSKQKPDYFPAAINDRVKTPLYYPSSLPGTFKVNNDAKVTADNILTYSISDAKANKYVVVIQALPASFDITAQKPKFKDPDLFNTTYGSVLVGGTVDGLLAMIRTNDNSLIIIHALNNDTQTQLETIIRALKLAS